MRHILAPALCCVALAACAEDPPQTGLANPAASFCVEQGGRHEIRDTTDGQTGICILPDGREVDAWAYFREQTGG
ncbi:putative hemolysin [Pukyongiella litopenaei]|uniref:DUF333 domain-containing protein n=1 Tax=Pukyongiella litopenaei TaxID=2605946 RepID=A0A2S0MKY0_9RHOB|nr:DUF333 domain-containing protein [Pukyongiella litopenaei]AVO36526.1 DUF333 domain-containing protein [Pukyongiella litopenaei]